jgi:DNA-binding GntR family transcriptional regulator
VDQALADLRITRPPQRLRDVAFERLRGAIIDGRFRSGERLVERSLCDHLGVSRSVVREAIRMLEAEGLVDASGRRGQTVATLDWEQARQIYDIRLLLEQAAAAACAAAADGGVKTELRAAFARIEAAFAAESGEPGSGELLAATREFYRIIFEAAGHRIAWEVVERLNGRISRLRAMTLTTTNRRVLGPARISRICEAICRNDPEAAAAAVREHLAEAAAIARRLLGGGGGI